MSVRSAQQAIDSREFAEWAAWDRVEVGKDEKVVFLLAQICSLMFNSWCRGKGRAMRPADFIPRHKAFDKPKSHAEMKSIFRAYANAHNGSINR